MKTVATYKNLNELIARGNQTGKPEATKPGIDFFIENPSNLILLIRADLSLAKVYFDEFSAEEINAIVKQAHAKKYFFFQEMIKTLYMNDVMIAGPKDHVAQIDLRNIPEKSMTLDQRFTEMFPSLKFVSAKDNNSHNSAYYYGPRFFCFAITLESAPISTKTAGWDQDLKNKLITYSNSLFISRHLNSMFSRFLTLMDKTYLLDDEVNDEKKNTLAMLLSCSYEGFAKFLPFISPEITMQYISAKPSNEKTILQFLLDNLPASKIAMKAVIECLQSLKFKNFEAFKAFIQNGQNDGLLSLLRKTGDNSELVQSFCAIAPTFIRDYYRTGAKGLDMPEEKENPVSKLALASASHRNEAIAPPPAALTPSAPPAIAPPPYARDPAPRNSIVQFSSWAEDPVGLNLALNHLTLNLESKGSKAL